MPSEDTRRGKEKAKLEFAFFEKCQKGREEKEPESLLHLRGRNECLVSRRIYLARFRDEI